MIGGVRILPRAPMVRGRAFGVLGRSGSARPERAERVFRKGVGAPARAVVQPVNLAVTNLTLSPRFNVLVQSHAAAVERLETVERSVVATARDLRVLEGRAGAAGAGRDGAPGLMRHAMRRDISVLPGRDGVDGAAGADGVPGSRRRRPGVSHRFFERRLRVDRREAAAGVPVRTARRMQQVLRVERQGAPVATTVAARRLAFFDRKDGVARGQAAPEDAVARGQMELRRDAGGMGKAAAGTRPEVDAMPARAIAPVDRAFRAEQPVAPVAPPAVVPPPVAPKPEAPEMDIAALDKVLWQRFEKRVRIEHERRGRG